MKGDPRIEIGGVSRAHGIRGEISIVTHDPDSTVLERVDTIWLDGVEHEIAAVRPTPKAWLVMLAGVNTRTEAEAFRGRKVEVAREALELSEDDVLLSDLIGCKVQLADGTPWGEIVAVEADFQNRLVIHDGGVERMLPLVDQLVPNIDLEARLVTVTPPEGMPDSPIVRGKRRGE
ncbi:MAG: 16S rRNA processing protein RimM [Deltaproteobacteria bacterium]|nr:16S rRNA processing protein RimM [Deltaproteobacteria bacterium]